MLELKGNDLVKTDPATGYYYMDKADDRVAPINITVPESVSGTSGDAQNTITLPETPVSSFGSVTIDNAPEFLSDDNTVLKLDNPAVYTDREQQPPCRRYNRRRPLFLR